MIILAEDARREKWKGPIKPGMILSNEPFMDDKGNKFLISFRVVKQVTREEYLEWNRKEGYGSLGVDEDEYPRYWEVQID